MKGEGGKNQEFSPLPKVGEGLGVRGITKMGCSRERAGVCDLLFEAAEPSLCLSLLDWRYALRAGFVDLVARRWRLSEKKT